jgi:hypothetical protein
MKLRIYALGMGFAGVVAGASAVDLVMNPGFEDGVLTPWAQTIDLGGPIDWQVTTAEAHTGRYSATVSGNKFLEQVLVANPLGADVIEFSFWLKTNEPHSALVIVNYTDGTADSDVVATANTDWTFFDSTSIIDSTKLVASIGFWGAEADPRDPIFYLDDVTLSADPVPEPATMAALALGAAALIRRRSR